VQLDIQVGSIDEEQDDGDATREHGHELRRIAGTVKDGWHDDASHSDGQQTGSRVRDHRVEILLLAPEAAGEEAHAHDQEEIGQDAAGEGGLDNDHLVVHQRDNSDNQFDLHCRTWH
jgi:hypothetical protein